MSSTSAATSRSDFPLDRLPELYPEHLREDAFDLPERPRSLDCYSEEDRQSMLDGIRSDMEKWDAPAASLKLLERFGQPNCYVVVTGQQAGIATGPLYTLYKAIGAIGLADRFRESFPEHDFIPLFWVEGDDHDFQEASEWPLLSMKGGHQTFRYDDGDNARRHVGERTLRTEPLRELFEEGFAFLGETDFSDEARRILLDSYREGETMADGFARTLISLLGDRPIAMISSRNSALKRIGGKVFEQHLIDPEQTLEAIRHASERLRTEGLPAPIEPTDSFFLTVEADSESGGRVRTKVQREGDQWVVGESLERHSLSELGEVAADDPERFSPNVFLRPIVQDRALPTAAYVGGPSEIAYQRQIRQAYDRFGMEPPAVLARPFVTVVEPKVERALEADEASIRRLFDRDVDFAELYVDDRDQERIDGLGDAALSKVKEAFELLEEPTGEIDESLVKALGAAERRAEKEIENFMGRLGSALKKRHEIEVRRMEGARDLLLPGGKLQERNLNPIYFINKYGIDAFQEAITTIEPARPVMQLPRIAG